MALHLAVAIILWCPRIQNVHVTASPAPSTTPCTNCDGNNVTCVDGVCPPRCVNVTSSGECPQCLDSRFYGKQCQHVCPDTCLNSRCQMDNTHVVCTEGCVAGKKGDNCGVNCPTACQQCERYGDGCTGPCQNPQYYGQHCRTPCPSICTGGCNRITGECDSCKPGYSGDKCDVTCPSNCRDGCDEDTGECDGCKPGYRGKNCNDTCPRICRDGCDKETGQCERCNPGNSGKYCNTSCPDTCSEGCTEDGKCQSRDDVPDCRVDDECASIGGYDKHTVKCDSCEPGYTGSKCDVTCPLNYRGGCDKNTGVCDSCEPGHTREKCDVSCPVNCTDGCNGITGECGSSEPGCTGDKCDDPCTQNSTDRCYRTNVPDAGPYLGTTCVVLAVIFILVVIVYKRRLRRRRQYQTGTPGTLHSAYTCSVSLPGGDLCDDLSGDTWMEHMLGEFQKLPSPRLQAVICASLDENKVKNRYKDILPFDAYRVTLEIKQDDDSDYINASYLDGYTDTARYVAAQGPLEQTKNDFWRMIWQLNTNKIVMLTNLMEKGRVKCHRYWPDGTSESMMYGCIRVLFVGEKVHDSHTVRSLAICKEGTETRRVQQFHFTQWPDHGVPEDTAGLLHFYKVVKESGPPLSGPLVVHCSAGVGRTGTFLALDYLLDQARNEARVCVYNCVQHFRMKRMNMVQTKEQYIFIHKILKDALHLEQTFKEPVHIQCQACWYRIEKHSDEEEVLYENLPRHWTRQIQHGDGDAACLPDVCDTVPLLTSRTDNVVEERVPEVTMDEEAGRVSWVSPH